ncbi:MAG: hypothetical protein GY751_05190, partial [Bacteroidetes bacterium]|nr:hypothetical protein [Bacteroidota bacterium]
MTSTNRYYRQKLNTFIEFPIQIINSWCCVNVGVSDCPGSNFDAVQGAMMESLLNQTGTVSFFLRDENTIEINRIMMGIAGYRNRVKAENKQV